MTQKRLEEFQRMAWKASPNSPIAEAVRELARMRAALDLVANAAGRTVHLGTSIATELQLSDGAMAKVREALT